MALIAITFYVTPLFVVYVVTIAARVVCCYVVWAHYTLHVTARLLGTLRLRWYVYEHVVRCVTFAFDLTFGD